MYIHVLIIIVVETHPENASDLRLDVPFPALEQYVSNINFNTQDTKEHSHIPFVAILLKYLNEWKENVNIIHCFVYEYIIINITDIICLNYEKKKIVIIKFKHNGALPKTYAEKNELKRLINNSKLK